jgi:hypothetical protein
VVGGAVAVGAAVVVGAGVVVGGGVVHLAAPATQTVAQQTPEPSRQACSSGTGSQVKPCPGRQNQQLWSPPKRVTQSAVVQHWVVGSMQPAVCTPATIRVQHSWPVPQGGSHAPGAWVVVGGGAVVGATQLPPMHWFGARQQTSPQQGESQQPSLAQQDWPGAQQGVCRSCRQMLSLRQQTTSPMQLAPDGQHSPPQHCEASSQQSSPQMVLPVGQQRPPAVQAPLQQPSREQVVTNSAQGSGGGVVGTGARVVEDVGCCRMSGSGRLP